jgi:hypothetical protein
MAPVPDWLQLCQAAFFELDPVKLLERIAEARSAVLDRIEDRLSKPINGEQIRAAPRFRNAERSSHDCGARNWRTEES